MFVVQGWKKSLKNLEVCNGFFSAILTHYYYGIFASTRFVVVVVGGGFFFFLLTCVCRVGLNLPHKTEKKQNPNCKP
jgi:hypothetical protein